MARKSYHLHMEILKVCTSMHHLNHTDLRIPKTNLAILHSIFIDVINTQPMTYINSMPDGQRLGTDTEPERQRGTNDGAFGLPSGNLAMENGHRNSGSTH